MKGLSFFKKTSDGSYNLVSYHSPHSMTWSWIFGVNRDGWSERRLWPILMSYRTNDGLQLILRIPHIAIFRWHRQRPIWYRNLYQRLRDERDGLACK